MLRKAAETNIKYSNVNHDKIREGLDFTYSTQGIFGYFFLIHDFCHCSEWFYGLIPFYVQIDTLQLLTCYLNKILF